MIDFPLNLIADRCKGFGAEIDDKASERLNLYGNLLLEWNEKMNLTAITEPTDIVVKHFFDCILFFKHIDVPKNAKIIDVGTGAGFPGMVLKIMRPDIDLTLLDGLNKRLIFLCEVLKSIGLSAEVVHLRAEDGGKTPLYREQYDFAVARAVARHNILSEYCLPYVKPGGKFVAMKGPAAEEEILESKRAIQILGGATPQIICEKLPTDEERSFIITKKISQTPPKYPRISAKISKQPL